MGHYLSGLIAQDKTLLKLTNGHNIGVPTAMEMGFSFLPLDNENLPKIVPGNRRTLGTFQYLTQDLIEFLAKYSRYGDIVYLETEYFGGAGGQGAAAFRAGKVIFGPEQSAFGSINKALARIGVTFEAPALDQFAAIGLRRRRTNEQFRLRRA